MRGTHAHAQEEPPPRMARARVRPEGTPPTDRGYQITDSPREPFQAHWFTGVSYLEATDTFNHIKSVTGSGVSDFVALRSGRMGYRSAYQTPGLPGLTVLCDPGEPDTMPAVCLVVPGESCEALGWDKLQALIAPFKPTRVDLAFDDFPFSPSETKALILSGSVRTRAHRHTVKYHEDFKDTTDDDLTPAQTVSLGSRGASAFFRCYNSRGFNRGELELKGLRAEAAYELLQSPLHLAREMAISFMRLFLDFVDPASSTNKSRQSPLPRWLFWYLNVQKATIDLPPRPVQTLKRTWEWFERQLSPMIAVLADNDLTRFHETLLDAEQTRWTDKHRLLLAFSA